MAYCDWCPTKYKTKFPKPFEIVKGHRQIPNPGTLADLHKKTLNIMPEYFSGVSFKYTKGIAPNKTMFGNWILSHTYPSCFRIGGLYSWKCFNDVMESPIIEADINPYTLASNFSFLFYPTSYLKFESRLQRTKNTNKNYTSIEILRSNETYTLSVFDAKKLSGRVTLSYLRNITENFSLGCELLYEWLGSRYLTRNAFAARYRRDKYSMAATISPDALDLSYWRQINKSVQLGTYLAFNKFTTKAIGSIYYQYETKNACIRGMIDSDFMVGSMYRTQLHKIPLEVSLSLLFCIPTKRFSFGITFDLDPSMKCGYNSLL